MKKTRLLAWLLIVAMLTLACPAIGEETEVDLSGNAAVESPDEDKVDLEFEADEYTLVDEGAGDDLSRRTHELTDHQTYYKSITKRIFHP